MFELIKAGGWIMIPILACSVVAVAIVAERFWTLRRSRITPENLVVDAWNLAREGAVDETRVMALRNSSPLGRVLAAGLLNADQDRALMKEAIEDVGRHVAHELERYLNALGTVASISPLLGLLGTVLGMIRIFTVITTHGTGNAAALAGGIGQALITTAAGLFVAIPSVLFYRYFRGRVDELVITMEQEALKLVEALHRRHTGVSRLPPAAAAGGRR